MNDIPPPENTGDDGWTDVPPVIPSRAVDEDGTPIPQSTEQDADTPQTGRWPRASLGEVLPTEPDPDTPEAQSTEQFAVTTGEIDAALDAEVLEQVVAPVEPPFVPQAELETEDTPAPLRRGFQLRWQFIVLGISVVAVIGAIAFMVTNRASAGADPDPEVPPEVIVVETTTYTEAVIGEPQWINPLLATSQADRDVAAMVFSGLTRLDDYGQPSPDLAEEWTISDDGRTYTFTLRTDATWHDGTPFTAGDVAFTMSLLRDPEYPGPADLGTFWRTVETYAVDDQTVQFVLTQPLAAFPEFAGIGILPAHILGGISPAALADDVFNLGPVGTGPMRWVGMGEEDRIPIALLEPYTAFYDANRRVGLEGLAIRYYPDADAAFDSLGEDAMGLGGLDAGQLNAALESDGLRLYSARMPVYGAIIFNYADEDGHPYFHDEAVRRALLLGLDRHALIATTLGRQAIPAHSMMLPGTWAFNSVLSPLPYAPERADTDLNEAGWFIQSGVRTKDDVPIRFTLTVSNTASDRELGEAIVNTWQALGIDVDLETVQSNALLNRLGTRDFDATLVEFSQGGLADPDPYAFWHESQIAEGQNYSAYNARSVSIALEIARRDANGVRRAELYYDFQEEFHYSAAAILLYNPVYHYAVTCQVEGVQLTILADPADRFRNLHEWRILPASQVSEGCR